MARVEARGRAAATLSCYVHKADHLLRVLGESTDINTFRPSVEDDYIDVRRREGASNHTIHKELVVLRAALRVAKRDGTFVGDCDALRAEGFSAEYVPRRTFLEPQEFRRLLDALPPSRRPIVAFMVYTGARHSEWQRVTRANVDLSGLLTLPGRKTPRSHQRLPLADHSPLADLLVDLAGTGVDPSVPLFERWTNIRRNLHAACDRAAIPRVSPNDLRRTFGTWCRRAGMPTNRIAVLLGHADSRMVERVYGTLDPAAMGPEIRAVFAPFARVRPGACP